MTETVFFSQFLVAEEKKEEAAPALVEDTGDVDDLVSVQFLFLTFLYFYLNTCLCNCCDSNGVKTISCVSTWGVCDVLSSQI